MRAFALHFLGLSLLGAILLWLGEGPTAPFDVDLTRRPWLAAPGRHVDAAFTPGEARLVRGFPIVLPALFADAAPDATDYTLATTFDLPRELTSAGSLPGLALVNIAGGYEIYVNGVLVEGPLVRDVQGRILSPHLADNLVVPLPRERLHDAGNRLAIHIARPLHSEDRLGYSGLGLLARHGYGIGSFDRLWSARGSWLSIFFVSLYTLFGFFAILLGIALSGSRRLIRFGLFALSLSLYYAADSAYLGDWVGDAGFLHHAEVVALYLAGAFGAMFIGAMLNAAGGLRALINVFAAVGFGGALAAARLPYEAAAGTLPLWEGLVFLSLILGALPAKRALARNAPHNAAFLPGLLLFTLSAGWDIVAIFGDLSSLRLAPYGVFLFVTSLASGMAQQSLFLHREAERVGSALEKSERRLRTFYSATREAVCIRRGDRILDVNPAFERLFGVPKERAVGTSFAALFERGAGETAAVPSPEATVEVTALRADGSRFDAECLNRVADVNDPELQVTAIRDISEYKRFRKELLDRNEELEALSRIVVDRELHMVELKRRIRGAGGKA